MSSLLRFLLAILRGSSHSTFASFIRRLVALWRAFKRRLSTQWFLRRSDQLRLVRRADEGPTQVRKEQLCDECTTTSTSAVPESAQSLHFLDTPPADVFEQQAMHQRSPMPHPFTHDTLPVSPSSYSLGESHDAYSLKDVSRSGSPRPSSTRSTRSRVEADTSERSLRGPHAQFGAVASSSKSKPRSRPGSRSPSIRSSSPIQDGGPMTPFPPLSRPVNSPITSDFSGVTIVSPSTDSLPGVVGADPYPSVAGPSCSVLAPDASQSSIASTFFDYPEAPENRHIIYFNPDRVPRYKNRPQAPDESELYELSPVTTSFPYSYGEDSADWRAATHPDGALYFHHATKNIYTEANMYDPTMQKQMKEFLRYLDECLEVVLPHRSFPDDYDLVVNIVVLKSGKVKWFYYYADHKSRTIFWVHHANTEQLIKGVNGVTSPAHIKHCLEAQYWNHWFLYPGGPHTFPDDAFNELLGNLLHNCIDLVASNVSTSPYDTERARMMFSMFRKGKSSGAEGTHLACSAARIMMNFAHWRFVHFHGQPAARLDQGTSVHGSVSRPRSLLITTLSPVLFCAPEVHLKEIEKLWADRIVIQSTWKQFINKLHSEWQELILNATVMLTVDVGFLAIPGVIPVNGDNSVTSALPAEIACYLSVLASAGSIIVGLLLVRQNRNKSREVVEGAAAYMKANEHPIVGLEPMAIMCSVPYALLMWSMVLFLVALLLLCFRSTGLATRIPVGLVSFIVASFILWCIGHSWETGHQSGRVWMAGFVPSWKQSLERTKAKYADCRCWVRDFKLRNFMPTLRSQKAVGSVSV